MPTFIDESGDTGQWPLGSSHFRLAAVWLPIKAVEDYRRDMQAWQSSLGLPSEFEFKFAKSARHQERTISYFAKAMEYPFRFAFASIDKRSDNWKLATAQELHCGTIVQLAATLRPMYTNRFLEGEIAVKESIFVDNCESVDFLKVVKGKFRELGKNETPPMHLIDKVRYRGSKPDQLIQLADMVCGACGANEEGKSNIYNTIAERDLGRNPAI